MTLTTARKISQDFLRSLFEYREGRLFWKERADVSENTNKARVGREAGVNPKPSGYHIIKVSGVFYRRSRIVWVWHCGEIPLGLAIDHIDRNRGNDRIENLRPATIAQNNINQPARRSICSTGITLDPRHGTYQARISVGRKRIHLGIFRTINEAQAAYAAAAIEHYGEFAPSMHEVRRHG